MYPLVEKLAGSEAGLVTGMILTLDISIVEEAVEEPEVELGSCGILHPLYLNLRFSRDL